MPTKKKTTKAKPEQLKTAFAKMIGDAIVSAEPSTAGQNEMVKSVSQYLSSIRRGKMAKLEAERILIAED